jgi:diguanylate cyclase (GGDEF)-like protein
VVIAGGTLLSSRDASFGVAGVGATLTVLYAAQISQTLSNAALMAVGVGTCAVQAIALRGNRVKSPWVLFLGTCLSFLVGMVLRPWSVAQEGAAAYVGDVFTVSGYVMLALALWVILRRLGLERHAVTDGVIVCLGMGLLAVELLALPAMRVGNRPEFISLLAGLYPLLDVVILLLVLNLAFSTATRLVSFRFLAATMVALFVGDLGYAWIGAQGRLTGSPLLDLPFLVGFTCMAAAALHPSRAHLFDVVARPVQAWSVQRLALIVPALAAPVFVALRPATETVDRVVLAVASAGLMAGLLLRALSAVRSYAAVQRGLRYQATHDALTGLPNRVLLSDRVSDMLRDRRRRERGVWLLFLDLDGFKLVNDHWGHEVGDALLVEVSRRLSALAPDEGTVARISGDEFVIAGPGSLAAATELAASIQAELGRPVEIPGIELIVASSIGIAASTDQLTADAMLRDADLAMYRAKADGRNRWRVFDAAMRQTVRDRVEIEIALRQAMAADQLWVAFQPIVDCRDGHVVGAEALLRWTHPTRGPISPIEFIPVAEETGLINEIGTFVLEESLRQLAIWQAEAILPPDFHVSVNASPRQLRDHRLHDVIDDALSRYRLSGSRLVLEITESIMMGDGEQVADVLGALRRLGVGLSVDDFGTGYSSLSYLSRFPVTAIKIDRAFVRGLGVDPDDEAIVRAVVAMAEALRLAVIAEGVETEEQRIALCGLDVVLAQGWLWAGAERPNVFADRHLRGSLAQAGVGNS